MEIWNIHQSLFPARMSRLGLWLFPSIGAGPRCTRRNLPVAVTFIHGTSEVDVRPGPRLQISEIGSDEMTPVFAPPRTIHVRKRVVRFRKRNLTFLQNLLPTHGPWISLANASVNDCADLCFLFEIRWTRSLMYYRIPHFSDDPRGSW